MILTTNSNLVITTSRKPSQLTRRFAQFLKHYFNSTYINRGKTSFNKVVNQARNEDYSKLLVITETKGNPSAINIYDLESDMNNPLYSIYINVSIPQEKNTINVNKEEITFINKSQALNELNEFFTPLNPTDKIKQNCIIIEDNDEKNNIASIKFIDKKGLDVKYKIYVTGYKIF
ncbi:hypothetical protein [Candidatus Methanosphaera massiliense]|jgi:U3 small nucleolar ribonucleoprotein protein IMP4|uniref:hypothetical protein n=1 Tax=Methanosphaera TaxID=2316 RepID=UPI0023806384|nr:hypothetical protein [Candidatus Methanosphaera massiliense]MDD6286195.1 hypothetical protein [Methanobacteriaceae archaeon]MDE4077640.1 hypothetical protein [Candidatus Methanosphaera massiliense]